VGLFTEIKNALRWRGSWIFLRPFISTRERALNTITQPNVKIFCMAIAKYTANISQKTCTNLIVELDWHISGIGIVHLSSSTENGPVNVIFELFEFIELVQYKSTIGSIFSTSESHNGGAKSR